MVGRAVFQEPVVNQRGEIGMQQPRLWSEYLAQLETAGASREASAPGSDAVASTGPACGR